MALGVMAVFFGVLMIISFVGFLMLLIVTNEKHTKTVILLTSMIALFITYINVTSRPMNDYRGAILSYAVGVLPLTALVLKFGLGKYDAVSKALIGMAIVVGMIMVVI